MIRLGACGAGLWGTHAQAAAPPRPPPAPEQLRQTKTPRFTDAQVGPRVPQSAHRRLSSCFSRPARIALCRSFCWALTLSFSLRTIAPGWPAGRG